MPELPGIPDTLKTAGLTPSASGGVQFALDGSGNVLGLQSPGGTIYSMLGPLLFTALPAASLYPGRQARVSDVGPTGAGSVWVSDGTVWRPEGGRVILKTQITDSVVAAGSAELVVFSYKMPVKLLQANGYRLRLRISGGKSGATDVPTVKLRFGLVGGSPDATAVSSSSIIASHLSFGAEMEFRRESASSMQKLGNGNSFNDAWLGGLATAFPSPVSLGGVSLDTQEVYVSLTFTPLATDSITVKDVVLELVA